MDNEKWHKRIAPVYSAIKHASGETLIQTGTAFIKEDGSITILLDCLPTSGKLFIKEEPR